jgi:hypothetical protein
MSEEPQFDDSLHRFEKFLAGCGYPPSIRWISPAEVHFTGGRLVYVRPQALEANELQARRRYAEGIANHMGVFFSALCSTQNHTYCYSWAPKNESEGEQTLQPRGLKMAAPTSDGKLEVEIVQSWWRWIFLRIRHFRHQIGVDLRFSRHGVRS